MVMHVRDDFVGNIILSHVQALLVSVDAIPVFRVVRIPDARHDASPMFNPAFVIFPVRVARCFRNSWMGGKRIKKQGCAGTTAADDKYWLLNSLVAAKQKLFEVGRQFFTHFFGLRR